MAVPPSLLMETLEKEKEKMFRIAWRMCGNPDDAEEVLQDMALKAIKNWDQFRGDSQVSTWLYRIASNTCLSRQRKRSLEIIDSDYLDIASQKADLDSMPVSLDWSRDPLTQTLNDELKSTMDEAIMKLPAIYRLVFLMRDIEGMSGEETANSLDISLSNVKVRLHRARMFLREELEHYVKSPEDSDNVRK